LALLGLDARDQSRCAKTSGAWPSWLRTVSPRIRPSRRGADERVVQGIHFTINGIAAGLRNSG
jgi:hypothetical protein